VTQCRTKGVYNYTTRSHYDRATHKNLTCATHLSMIQQKKESLDFNDL